MPGPNETKVFYCSGPDRRLWRGKVQLALPVHKERVQFGVKIDHWSRVCHQIHPGIRDVLKLGLHVEKLSESTISCRLTGRQLRPRSGTQLARSVIEPSLQRKSPSYQFSLQFCDIEDHPFFAQVLQRCSGCAAGVRHREAPHLRERRALAEGAEGPRRRQHRHYAGNTR